MILIVVMMLALLCSVMAIRAQPLLHSVLWLGGLSATIALLLYLIGAHQIAVIELSISAGLTTVLFVFAISSVGAETTTFRMTVRPLGYVLILLLLMLTIASISLISLPDKPQTAEAPLSEVLGQDRAFDMVAQIALIFVGILGVLNLLVTEEVDSS